MILNKLDKRQKIVLFLLVLVTIVLIWQGYNLFAESGSAPVPAVPKVTAAAAPKMPAVPPASPGATTVAAATPAANIPAPIAQGGGAAVINPATNSQSEYLRLVNEYQMAQLQRMIAENNEAIAVAKRNAAQAVADTSRLIGSSTVTMSSANDQGPADSYTLIYTGQQGGQWTATVKKNGQTYDVVVGGQLPDGLRVTSIDENSVLLMGNAGKLLVTFAGQTKINTAPTAKANVPVLAPAPVPVSPAASISAPIKETSQELRIANPISARNDQKKTEKESVSVAKAEPVKQQPTKPVAVAKTESVKPSVTLTTTLSQDTGRGGASVAVAQPTVTDQLTSIHLQVPLMAKSTGNVMVGQEEGKRDNKVAQTQLSQPLSQKNPQHYTIQLSTNTQKSSLEDFIKANKLGKEATYFQAQLKNGTRYILIYGDYADRTEAQTALEKLQETIASKDAFLVSYGAVQAMQNKKSAVTETAIG